MIFLHANPFVTSGFVEVGETVEAATIREVQEETNLRLSRLVMDYSVIYFILNFALESLTPDFYSPPRCICVIPSYLLLS